MEYQNNLHSWIQKKSVQKAVIAAALLFVSISVSGMAEHGKECLKQREIAGKVLRFHVRANSDSEEDQNLKCKVRDQVVKLMQEYLRSAAGKEEAEEILLAHLQELVQEAESLIRSEGYFYGVSASIHKERFPERIYGDMRFPEGVYDALVIEIGSGNGHNWWCVMYPSLCFLDKDTAEVPKESKDYLEEELTREAYQSLLVEGEEEKVEFRFAIVDWLRGWR